MAAPMNVIGYHFGTGAATPFAETEDHFEIGEAATMSVSGYSFGIGVATHLTETWNPFEIGGALID